MKKFITCCSVLLLWQMLFAITIWAVPAYPGLRVVRQPDGTQLEVRLCGDERFHFYATADGIVLQQDTAGFFRYAVWEDGNVVPGKFVARNSECRSVAEQEYVNRIDSAKLRMALSEKMENRRVAPGEILSSFPTLGSMKGLVLLVEYQDVRFCGKATRDDFDKLMNEENYSGHFASGSVHDYFKSQSAGQFDVHFDVVGPITLPYDMAYYGTNTEKGENAREMVVDAVELADTEFDIDFSQYDVNSDGFVDFIYVIYAGYAESQGGPSESIWPQSDGLEYYCMKMFDGMYLGRFSCSAELRGNMGQEIDGIGTFCHEFSHILGLPDIYDPLYSGFNGLGRWDVMDIGSYNGNSCTPAGYTAMERYTLGWLEPKVLEWSENGLELEASDTSHDAWFIVSDKDKNAYFTLENRQNVGWDTALPGHGLMICRIHYDIGLWKSNRVNTKTSKYEHVMLVTADNVGGSGTEAADLFPGPTGNKEFSANSVPAAIWPDGSKAGFAITDIRETDGKICFNYNANGSGSDIRMTDFDLEGNCKVIGNEISIFNPLSEIVEVYTMGGELVKQPVRMEYVSFTLPQGCYLIRIGGKTVKAVVMND